MSPSVRRRALVASGVATALAAVSLVVPLLGAGPAAAQEGCGPVGDTTLESTPWGNRRLDLAAAWPLSRGEGVTVAVIDSGVSPDHPVLRGKVLPGRDFGLPDQSGHCDQAGHGTLIAGIIAGRSDPDAPFTGVAPGAQILPGRVLERDGNVRQPDLPSQVATAIRWAVDEGADVINLSLVVVPTQELIDAIEYAWDNDVVMVAAAGNLQEGEARGPAFPAADPRVVAVAGINRSGGHVDTSVTGEYISVAAPGHEIEGPAARGDGYRLVPDGGTSYATGYVSGVAALLRSAYPQLSAARVISRIQLTADRPPGGHDELVGHGVVNPYRALSTVLGTRTNPPVDPVQPSAAVPDPLADEKRLAATLAAGGLVLALLLLLGRSVLVRGRQRGWRPTRPTPRGSADATGDAVSSGSGRAIIGG